ncbi:hydrolase [Streptomyces albipurpureus]|uniref:Hydrolase n=1 Tax=Streptomyces albipurpureus TaxID=2897419 RepID=A0ABT0UMU1_9ACTN|nr:hydrolase [Streptomyces sp. CWNU-1]MCM2389937.1 hydrolase [Streptomyces sp. CWNU-1]
MTSPKGLLDPSEAVIVFIDHQPMTLFGVHSHDPQTVVNNTVALAETARLFNVPVVYSTVARKALGGDLIPGLREVFPDQEIIDRSWINAWEDPRLKEAVLATGRRQIVIAGLWTEMCVAFPVISALEEGREVFVVADASGGASSESHHTAMDRMVAKGAVPVTTQVVLGEFQRDWARQDSYLGARSIAQRYFGNWGQVLDYYAQTTTDQDASTSNH